MQEHSSSSVTQRASSKRSPIFFVENVGQFADARIQFQAQLGSSILTVRNKSLILSVLEPLPKRQRKPNPSSNSGQVAPPTRQGVNLNLKFVGANKKIKIVPFRRIDTRMSFYLGDNPDTWRTDVPVWEGVRLKNFYPKIDLVLTSKDGRFTPRLVARKGADVSQVKLRIRGAQELNLAENGVQVKTAVRAFTLPLFQVVNKTGNKFDLLPAQIENDVIVMPLADRASAEKAEATLDDDTIYETFFNVGDFAVAGEIAVDAAGNAYLAGDTYFGSYPDIFLVKLDADGTLLQTTVLGGTTSDWSSGIALDGSGNAYVSGSSDSSTLAQGVDTLGHSDGILAKFNPNGDLEWARRVGGVSFDNANGVAVHGNTVVLVGNIKDTEDPELVYAPDVGFVATFDLNGSGGAPNLVSLAESTVVSSAAIADNGTVWITGFGSAFGGGCNPCIAPEAATNETCCFAQNYSTGETKWFDASAENLALDSAGNVYMVGSLGEDVAVSRWGTDGNVVTQTFGGNGFEYGSDIATSAQGEIFVVGQTSSTDWIVQSGNYEGFVMGLNSNLTTTWTRANGSGYTSGVAVDGSGAVYVTGSLFGAGLNAYAMQLIPPSVGTPTPTATATATATFTPTATPTPNVPLVTLEVTDANGTLVNLIERNQKGWYAQNPITVHITITNPNPSTFFARIPVSFGSQTSVRFYVLARPTPAQGPCSDNVISYNGSAYSFVSLEGTCELVLEPNQTVSMEWELWVQPSNVGQLDLRAELQDPYGGVLVLGQAQKTVSTQLAQIHPIALVPGLFGSSTAPTNSFYSPLFETLMKMGYEDGRTLFTESHNWLTVSHAEMAGGLQSSLRSWRSSIDSSTIPYVKQNPFTFDLIGHSQGALVLRAYLELLDDNDFAIGNVFLIGGPNKGVVTTYRLREGLDASDTGIIGNLFILLPAWALGCGHYTIITTPIGGIPYVTKKDQYEALHDPNCHLIAPAELLPAPGTADPPYLVDSNGNAYPYGRLRNPLLESRPTTSGEDPWFDPVNTGYYELNSKVEQMKQRLGGSLNNLFVLYNDATNLGTLQTLVVTANTQDVPLWTNGKALPIPTTGPGDNTISGYSAIANDLWTDIPGVNKVLINNSDQPNQPAYHTNLAVYSDSQKKVVEIITGNVAPFTTPLNALNNIIQCGNPFGCGSNNQQQNQVQETTQSNGQSRLVILGENSESRTGTPSPVDFLLTDALGRRLGYDPPTGQIVNEIPTGLYAHVPESPTQLLLLQPPSGGYTLTITGTGSGSYRIYATFADSIAAVPIISETGNIQAGETRTVTLTLPAQSIDVATPPDVNAGANISVQLGQSITFSGSFQDINPNDTHTIHWDFGDGTNIVGTLTPTHTFNAMGVFTVTLTVTDSSGFSVPDIMEVTVVSPPTTPTSTPTNTPTATPIPSTAQDFYFHGAGPNNNPPTLLLNANAPTSGTAKYKDSTSVNFNNGNPWKEIGIWSATGTLPDGTLSALDDLHLWLGLKNSDDQGTRFDLRAEIFKNGTLVASGETYCIQGITRNANNALESVVTFEPFAAQTFDGTNDVLSLKVLTRIGTNGSGGFCGGHSNAVGLRLYFDALNRPSRFDAVFGP